MDSIADRYVTTGMYAIRAHEAQLLADAGLDLRPEVAEPPLDLYAYQAGMKIARDEPPFAALIFAALYRADSTNARIIRAAFPGIATTGQQRYDAPGGRLPGEQTDDAP